MKTLFPLIAAILVIAPLATLADDRETRSQSEAFEIALNYSRLGDYSTVGEGWLVLTVAVRGGAAPYTLQWTFGGRGGTATLQANHPWATLVEMNGSNVFSATVTDSAGMTRTMSLRVISRGE